MPIPTNKITQDRLPPLEEEVLKLLYTSGNLSIEQMAQQIGHRFICSTSEITDAIDRLSRDGFIKLSEIDGEPVDLETSPPEGPR